MPEIRHPTKHQIMTQEEMKLMDDTKIIHEGYTRTQLNAAFERVQNRENWKMPTRAIYVDTLEEAKVIDAAIGFYTGGHAEYFETISGYCIPMTAGYYHYIGA